MEKKQTKNQSRRQFLGYSALGSGWVNNPAKLDNG